MWVALGFGVGCVVGGVVAVGFVALVGMARRADEAAQLLAHQQQVVLPPGWEEHPSNWRGGLRIVGDEPE